MVPKNEPSEVKKSRNSRKVQNFNFLRLRRPERICSGLAPGKRCLRGVESAKSAKSCVLGGLYPPGTPRLPRRTPPATSARRRWGPWVLGCPRGAPDRCVAHYSAPGYLGAEAAALRAGLPLATSVRRPLRYAATSVRRGEVVVSHPSPRPPWSTRANTTLRTSEVVFARNKHLATDEKKQLRPDGS